jgi:uncharacterized protein with PQ loop repeat
MSSKSYHFHITKKDEKRLINRICSVAAILMPLTTLPQIHLLYSTKNAESLSLAMWVLYMIGCIPFLAFGYIYKHKQLIVLNSLWIIMQTIMIIGIIMYS